MSTPTQAQQMSLGSQLEVTSIPSVFALGNRVTLYHGNCMEFLQAIPDESVQSLSTDPSAYTN
jgi:DNA modification methylase